MGNQDLIIMYTGMKISVDNFQSISGFMHYQKLVIGAAKGTDFEIAASKHAEISN